jgi:hypothetical protein
MYNDSTPIDGQVSSVLIAAINQFPQEWALTPCVGKQNFWPQWQKQRLDRAQLIEVIRSQTNQDGKHCAWTGVSVVTGSLSNGLMAIDFDGPAAIQKYLKLSGNQLPPTTMKWSSGKTGHFQILLQVAKEKWEGLKPQKIELENGNKLELRWNQCSTLPPSIHPDTEKPYFWQLTGKIAECPDFILELMREAPAVELPQNPKSKTSTHRDEDEKNLVDILEQEILPRLDAEEFYGNYLKLKAAGKNLKALCPFHDEKTPSFNVAPAQKTFHCFGCGTGGGPVQFLHQIKGGTDSPTGKDFYSVVMELADRVGVEIGDRNLQTQNVKSKIQNPKSNNVPQHLAANVIRPPQFQVRPISELEGEIETLLDSDLKKSQLQLKISELAQKFRINSADVWKTYRERQQELEQEADQEGTATEVAQLLASKSATLNLTAILPSELAEAITRLAQTLNIKPECYALALLTQVSTLLKPGTRTMLYPQTNFRVCPNFFGALIAESSQKKTPIIRAIITDPMEKLNAASRKAFKEAEAAYEEELNAWTASKSEDKGSKPQKPGRKVYYITTATGESIPKQAARVPDQSLMWVADELAGMLKSPNQYRSGKGADEENLLEYWSGGGAAVLRADGLAVDAPHVGLSIFGNIQPKVLAQFLGDGSDDNGKFARFELIQQPLAATELFEDAPSVDLTPMLSALYEHLDPLPPQNFRLDASARKLFIAYYNQCERERVTNPKQGMRAMLGKAPEKVGKVATILHAIHSAFRGGEIAESIPAEIVRGAIQFVKYTTDQALSVNLDICEPSALAPNLARILDRARVNGGTVCVREYRDTFNKKTRPESQLVKDWFKELENLKHGYVTQKGLNFSFTLSPQSTVSTLDANPDAVSVYRVHSSDLSSPHKSTVSEISDKSVDYCGLTVDYESTPFETLEYKALKPTVDTVDSKNHFPENSDSLMLGCATKTEEFAEQIKKAITNFDRSLATKVWDVLKPKTKRELRAEVISHLTATEAQNFKLLVAAGFLRGTRVKYVGDPKYAEQYEGLELEVCSIDEYSLITCRKPDGAGYTTRMKPEELEKL